MFTVIFHKPAGPCGNVLPDDESSLQAAVYAAADHAAEYRYTGWVSVYVKGSRSAVGTGQFKSGRWVSFEAIAALA